MRKMVAVVPAIFLALFTPTASQAVAIGDDAPPLTFNTPDGRKIDIRDYRGKLLIVDFNNMNVDMGREYETDLVALMKKHTDDGVAVVGVWFDNHVERSKGLIESAGVNWPVWADNSTALRDTMQAWKHQAVGPVLVSPSGKVLYTGYYKPIDDKLANALITNPPTIIDPDDVAKANTLLDAATHSLDAKDNAAALKSMAALPTDAPKNKALAQRISDLQPRIQKAIAELLTPADRLIADHKNLSAIDALHALAPSVKGSAAEPEIEKRLQTLQADPQTKSETIAAANEQKAAQLLDHARVLRNDQKLGDAYQQFKDIVTDYPGTPSATAAGQSIKAFESDPALMAQVHQQIADRKAGAMLSLARNYASSGQNDQARAKYQQVIDQFPGSTQADAAKTEMAALK